MFIAIVGFLVMGLIASGSLLSTWLVLLGSSLVSCVVISLESVNQTLKYFIVQEISSWLYLLGVISSLFPLVPVVLFLKIGLPPLHSWFISVAKGTSSDVFLWLISPAKVVALIILFFTSISTFLPVVGIIFSLLGVLSSLSVKVFILYSSVINIIWGYLTSSFSFLAGLVFTLSYMLFVYISLSIGEDGSVPWMAILTLTGLPPSFVFFLKVFIISSTPLSVLVIMIFIVSTTVLALSYLYIWESSVLNTGSSPSSHHSSGYIDSFGQVNLVLVVLVLLLFVV